MSIWIEIARGLIRNWLIPAIIGVLLGGLLCLAIDALFPVVAP